jgi:hypothetical protein
MIIGLLVIFRLPPIARLIMGRIYILFIILDQRRLESWIPVDCACLSDCGWFDLILWRIFGISGFYLKELISFFLCAPAAIIWGV